MIKRIYKLFIFTFAINIIFISICLSADSNSTFLKTITTNFPDLPYRVRSDLPIAIRASEVHSFNQYTYVYAPNICPAGYSPLAQASVKETQDSSDTCEPTGYIKLNWHGCTAIDSISYRCDFDSKNYYYASVCPNKGVRFYFTVWCVPN